MIGVWNDISRQEKHIGWTDKQFSRIFWISDTFQCGDNVLALNDGNSAEYKILVKVSLALVAMLLKEHTESFKFMKPVINCILIGCYHFHSKTVLQHLQDVLSGINSNIHHILTYFISHIMNKIPKIPSLDHNTKNIRDVGSADNSDSKISGTTHKDLIKDGYHSSSNFHNFQHMLW